MAALIFEWKRRRWRAQGIKLRGKGGKEKSKWFAKEGIEAEPLIFGRHYCLLQRGAFISFDGMAWHGMEIT